MIATKTVQDSIVKKICNKSKHIVFIHDILLRLLNSEKSILILYTNKQP
jgi:hypothetical protein